MSGSRIARIAAAVATATLFAGCGGDDSPPDADGASAPAPTDGTDEGTGSDDAGNTAAPGSGFIQIGDLRQELTVELCANVFGAINGRAVSASESGAAKVVFNIAPEDWAESATFDEPGSIQYSESLVDSWTTGQHRYIDDYELPADVDASSIAITSYNIADDDQSVTGEATFYDLNALVYETPVAPQTGSFAFACPSS